MMFAAFCLLSTSFATVFNSKTVGGFVTDVANHVLRDKTINAPNMTIDQRELLLHLHAEISQVEVSEICFDFIDLLFNFTKDEAYKPPYEVQRDQLKVKVVGAQMKIKAYMKITSPAPLEGAIEVTPASVDGSDVKIDVSADMADLVVPMNIHCDKCDTDLKMNVKYMGKCGPLNPTCAVLDTIIPLLSSSISSIVSGIVCDGTLPLMIPSFPGVKKIVNKDVNQIVEAFYGKFANDKIRGQVLAKALNTILEHGLPHTFPDIDADGFGIKDVVLANLSASSVRLDSTGIVPPLPQAANNPPSHVFNPKAVPGNLTTSSDILGLKGEMNFQVCTGPLGCEKVIMKVSNTSIHVDTDFKRDDNGFPIDPKAHCKANLTFTLAAPDADFLFQEFLKSISSVFGDLFSPVLCDATEDLIDVIGGKALAILSKLIHLIQLAEDAEKILGLP